MCFWSIREDKPVAWRKYLCGGNGRRSSCLVLRRFRALSCHHSRQRYSTRNWLNCRWYIRCSADYTRRTSCAAEGGVWYRRHVRIWGMGCCCLCTRPACRGGQASVLPYRIRVSLRTPYCTPNDSANDRQHHQSYYHTSFFCVPEGRKTGSDHQSPWMPR